MPKTQINSGALRDAAVTLRAAATGHRAAVLLGAIGMMAGAAVMTAAPALAGVGSEPGNVKFSPASGATKLTPTWSTSDGCPSGYQGSAQMAIFDGNATLLSAISNVAYDVKGPFTGELDGNLGAILRFAKVPNDGSLEFAVGCYSQQGATGKVDWLQSTLVTLSSDGTSYSTSTPSGQWVASASNQAKGALAGVGVNAGTNTAGHGANPTSPGGMGAPAEAALIAGACALAAGAAGYVWYRRRNRSRLM
jgi:hypothetical protein